MKAVCSLAQSLVLSVCGRNMSNNHIYDYDRQETPLKRYRIRRITIARLQRWAQITYQKRSAECAIYFFLVSEAQCNFCNELFDSVEAQLNSAIKISQHCKYRIFCHFRQKKVNNLLKKADIYQYYDRNGTKLSSMYRIALFTKKKKKKI